MVSILPACSGEVALALAFPACPLPQRAIFLFLSSFISFCFVFLFCFDLFFYCCYSPLLELG